MDIVNDENQQKAVFVDEEHQKELNKPLPLNEGMDAVTREFLDLLIAFVESGKIDLYKPHTVLNDAVYSTLDEQKKGAADLEAVNILAAIREIQGLYDAGYVESYQMKNLVERLKFGKEELEKERGDLFII